MSFTLASSVGGDRTLYEQGGIVTMLRAFALCLLAIAAAIIPPREIRIPIPL